MSYYIGKQVQGYRITSERDITKRGASRWRGECIKCGKQKWLELYMLRGTVHNCRNCQNIEKREAVWTRQKDMPHYRRWCNMIQRCQNPNNPDYHTYGGIGIVICDEWLDFQPFHDWCEIHYVKGYSLDRKNSCGDYTPDNCRFASHEAQARNANKPVTNTSGYKGARLAGSGRWDCYVNNTYVSTHDTAREAGIAYNNYVIKHSFENSLNLIEEVK